MTRDQKRIASVANFMDGIGENDFHQLASEFHDKRCACRRGPTTEDYYRAVAKSLDSVRWPSKAGGDQT